MRTRLVPLDGGPPIELAKDMTLVGRTEDCDVRIDHKSVSKLHCVLVRADGLVLVRDLGSTNGTRVNGQRVRRAALLPDDHMAIAHFRYQLRLGEAPDDPPVAPAAPSEASAGDETPPPTVSVAPPTARQNALPDVYPDKPG